jgi:hypothetical protein
MTITLDPPTRQRLEARARQEGKQAEDIAAALLADSLSAEPLEDRQSELLRFLSDGLPESFWRRRDALEAQARAKRLTPEEYEERLELSDRLERWHLDQMDAVLELARLRGASPQSVMQKFGLLPGTT